MPPASNSIATRQHTEALWRVVGSIPAGKTLEGDVRDVKGYSVVNFLVFANDAVVLDIEEANTPDGPFAMTASFVAVLDTNGRYIIREQYQPTGSFARALIHNSNPGPVTELDLSGLGLPYGGSTGGGGGAQGAQGAGGPPGIQGAQGSIGSGFQGLVGAQGLIGPIGNQGSVGPLGNQGSAGPLGSQGATGPVGNQGSTGPIGNQGSTGPVGNQGSTGPVGNQGSTGPIGNQGATGPIGTQGPTGSNGPQGSVGPQGDAGLNGAQGTQGPQGPVSSLTPLEALADSGGQTGTMTTSYVAIGATLSFTLAGPQGFLFEGFATASPDPINNALDVQLGINIDGTDYPGTAAIFGASGSFIYSPVYANKAIVLGAGPHTIDLVFRKPGLSVASQALVETNPTMPAKLTAVYL